MLVEGSVGWLNINRPLSLTQLEEIVRANLELIKAVWNQKRPVIAALNGHAVAAGASLAMACDIVIAALSATLAEPEIPHGALSPWCNSLQEAPAIPSGSAGT